MTNSLLKVENAYQNCILYDQRFRSYSQKPKFSFQFLNPEFEK